MAIDGSLPDQVGSWRGALKPRGAAPGAAAPFEGAVDASRPTATAARSRRTRRMN
jgi:hypothetical protein